MQRDYKEEYQKTKSLECKRILDTSKYIYVARSGKTKLNVSINPYLKDEFKKISSEPVAHIIEKFIKEEIEKFHNKKIIMKR